MPTPVAKRPGPRFACRLSKQTGDGEMVEVSLTADDAGELEKRLTQATQVLERRMEANNAKVLRLQAVIRDQQAASLEAAALKAAAAGAFEDAAARNGGAHADAPAGAADAPADP